MFSKLLRREGKQAIKSKTDKQSIKFKAGEIKCCKEIKITAPPNEWCNIPFSKVIRAPWEERIVADDDNKILQ